MTRTRFPGKSEGRERIGGTIKRDKIDCGSLDVEVRPSKELGEW